MDNILEIENLKIKFEEFQLGPINLDIQKGEIFALLGQTGAGKTLLMEMISGFYKNYEGNIQIFSKRPIGIVFQDYALFPHFTVEENIAYGLKCRNIDKKEINKSVEDITKLLGIDHLLKNYPNTLSGGEKQRTALARTMILKPEILLLDEPFSALDIATREKIYNEIQIVKDKYNCTIIFVTHDFNEAVKLADRIGIILHGKIRDIVPANKLFIEREDIEVNEFLRMGKQNDKKDLFDFLKNYMKELLEENGLEGKSICIQAKGLSPEEAIGITERKDYPILTGQEVMLSAEFDGAKGQAFTSAPCEYKGSIQDILENDLLESEYDRALFIAALNALTNRLGKANKTIHCRNEGPEKCALSIREYLMDNYDIEKIALIGYQPAILASLVQNYTVRVLDLNPSNIGEVKSGVVVEDGKEVYEDILNWSELILCTGSTICNGSIVDYLDIDKEVIFFGITLAGAAPALEVKRLCFTEETS